MNEHVFNVWHGVVEDRKDPSELGRAKVRIFGLHTENKNLLPTKDLPWVTASTSINGSNMFSAPDEGSYVYGFFADGESNQAPVMVGFYQGYKSNEVDASSGFNPTKDGQYKNSTTPTGETARDPYYSKVGTNSVPPTARGAVTGTPIYKTNNNLAHACDINFIINFDVGLGGLINPVTAIRNAIQSGKQKAPQLIRILMMKLNEFLRLALDAIIAALSFDKTGMISAAVSQTKAVIAKINEITKKIAEIAEIAGMVIGLVEQIKQLIAFFKSLPAKLLAIVKDCIAGILSSIQNILAQFQSLPGGLGNNSLSNALNSLLEENQNVLTAGNDLFPNTEIQIGNTTINISSYIYTTDANTIEELFTQSQITADAYTQLISDFANTGHAEITLSGSLSHNSASYSLP